MSSSILFRVNNNEHNSWACTSAQVLGKVSCLFCLLRHPVHISNAQRKHRLFDSYHHAYAYQSTAAAVSLSHPTHSYWCLLDYFITPKLHIISIILIVHTLMPEGEKKCKESADCSSMILEIVSGNFFFGQDISDVSQYAQLCTLT